MARPKRETELEEDIRRLEELADAAENACSFSAAQAARSRAAALRQDLHRIRDTAAANRIRDDARRTGALRRIAERAGSWVAAQKLAVLEQEIREKQARRAQVEADQAWEAMGPDELVDTIIAAAGELPTSYVERIAEALLLRLGLDADLVLDPSAA